MIICWRDYEQGTEFRLRVFIAGVISGIDRVDYVCAAAGGVYTWGRGLFGRLGVGVFQDELIPTHVAIGTNSEDNDGGGSSHSGSSHSSGRENSSRAQKDGANRSKVSQVAAGAYHNLALTADGSVWSWGYNACILHSSFYQIFCHNFYNVCFFPCLCFLYTDSVTEFISQSACSLIIHGRSAWS